MQSPPFIKMANVIAVDPGKESGWCVFDADKKVILDFGLVNNDDIVLVCGILRIYKTDTLIIEDQYTVGRIKLKAYKTLLRRRYIWEIVETVLCIQRFAISKIIPVNPRSWKSFYKILSKDKEYSIQVANDILSNWRNNTNRKEIRDSNVADAICLANYYFEKHIMGRKEV